MPWNMKGVFKMRIYSFGSILIALAMMPSVWLNPASAFGQSVTPKAQDLPRLPNGKPDFSGVWDHPRVQDVTRDGKTCGGGTPGCSQKGSGELSFTPEGAKRWQGPRIDYTAYCLPWGYSRSGQVEYPLEIVQKPDRLAFLFESNNVFHVVYTDGRDHPKDLEPKWLGHSTGKWEGDALVIDTIGFNGKTYIDTAEHPASDALHMIERISYVDGQHLSYEVTWEDSKLYTKPIKNTRVFARMKPGEELMEYWCMENNRTLLDGHLPRLHLDQ
jgi:hypothetical protein